MLDMLKNDDLQRSMVNRSKALYKKLFLSEIIYANLADRLISLKNIQNQK